MYTLRDCEQEKTKWVTVLGSQKFYPDYQILARQRYIPFIKHFGELLAKAADSVDLYRLIQDVKGTPRIQLLRIFRRYVAPSISVEVTKRKAKTEENIRAWADQFRPLDQVRARYATRGAGDDALVALLVEHDDRGGTGYELTGEFFKWFHSNFDGLYSIEGPIGAGKDIMLSDVFPDWHYETDIPIDFVIRDRAGIPLVLGFARYDSDRGGAQEDDRTGGYEGKIKFINFALWRGVPIKMVFLNDGPGLTAGSMWDDYAHIEEISRGMARVVTLKMLGDRVTREWIEGRG